MRQDARNVEPYHWWGPGRSDDDRRSLASLLRDDTIDPECAAIIWAAMARRQSLVVVAGPSGLGKTTLLTALCDLLPPGTRRVYLRGCYETFGFRHDPTVEPARTAILINELSPHLPVYCWGPAVRQALAAAATGFMLLATAHAESVAQFVALLAGSPLRIPPAEIAAFDLVVLLDRSPDARSGRRVRDLWRLAASGDGVTVDAEWAVGNGRHNAAHGPREDRHDPELDARERLLTALREGQIARLPLDAAALDPTRNRPLP